MSYCTSCMYGKQNCTNLLSSSSNEYTMCTLSSSKLKNTVRYLYRTFTKFYAGTGYIPQSHLRVKVYLSKMGAA